MKRASISQTITEVEIKVTKKARNKLYLVLREKGMIQRVIDEINDEAEKRFINSINILLPKLNEMHFDNPEEILTCLFLKKMIEILDQMLKEKILLLNDKDKNLLFETIEKGEEEKNESFDNQK